MEKTTQAPLEQVWQGAVEARLPSTPGAAAWPHLASFCAVHRYRSGIDVYERVAGEDGRPGCVCYVASRAAPAPVAGEEDQDKEAAAAAIAKWAREERLALDDAARRLSYAVVDSNMGFGRNVATMAVLEKPELEPAGCRLVWEFECEPAQGWSRDGLVGYLDAAVKGMAARIEEETAATAACRD